MAKKKTSKKKAIVKKTKPKKKVGKAKVKKAKKTASKKKATPKKKATKKAAKRKAPAAFMRPRTPSEVLAAIIGPESRPGTEITQLIWKYIKKHDLQDKTKRIMINADAKLKQLFGGKSKVSMFEMTKWVNKHLVN